MVAPSLTVLVAASVFAGFNPVTTRTTRAALAADRATADHLPRALAAMFSGILAGMLLARIVSGVVWQSFGWRTMLKQAAVVVIGLVVLTAKFLPRLEPSRRQCSRCSWF